MKDQLLLTLLALFIAGTLAPAHAQTCGPCEPGVKPGYTPGAPMTVYLDFSLSPNEMRAATDAVNAWNNYYTTRGLPAPYTITNNAFGANITFEEDPTLHNTYQGATTTYQVIGMNPDYQNSSDGFLWEVASHEMGHAIGFTDVTASGCAGQTVMFGNITQGASYTTGPTSVDWRGQAHYSPPPPTNTSEDTLDQCDPNWGCAEPIVFSLDNGSYRLSGLDDPVAFDIFGVGPRGGKPQIGWTDRGSQLAFLAFDRNGNGSIDGGGELFGNATLLRSGQHAANGFDALAEYDDDGDGQIDTTDRIWQYLLLWVDRNHDGVSQPEELQRISDSSITSIEIAHHWTNRRDPSGNLFGYQGQFHEGHRVRIFYDVFFVIAN